MTQVGGCICGNVRYEVEGEPTAKALCHCGDCRKTTGSTYSTNGIYPEAAFKLTQGTPKVFTKTAGSGNDMESHFCGDCGSTLWRQGKSYAGLRIVKIGTLDDVNTLISMKPIAELFAPGRIPWVAAIEGAVQKKAMS